MLANNIDRRVSAAVFLFKQTKRLGISNADKSYCFRAAFILCCTVVEGLVYELVKKSTKPPHVLSDKIEYCLPQEVNKNHHSLPEHLYLCKKKKTDLTIDTEGVGFGMLNNYLKNHKIVTADEYAELNWVRLRRNEIHVQGLTKPDVGYTRARVNRVAETIVFLLKKIYSSRIKSTP